MVWLELWHVCCLQKKHKSEKAGNALKQKQPEQHVKKGRIKLEDSGREQEASARPSALRKQHPEEDIQISDSDLDGVSPILSGYLPSTGLSTSPLKHQGLM